jgi:hypothetical protein
LRDLRRLMLARTAYNLEIMRTEWISAPKAGVQVALGAMSLLLLSLLFLTFTGVSFASAFGLTLVVSVQALAGGVLWHALRKPAGIFELLGMGLALGPAISVISGLVVRTLFSASWGWILPSCFAILWIIFSCCKGTVGAGQSSPIRTDKSVLVAFFVSVLIGALSLLGNIRNYPLTWEGNWGRYHPDMPFFEALSISLAKFGPFDSIFLPGGEVRYHWLAYAWSGQVTEAAGADSFVMLTRGLQLVAVLASSLLVISWTRQLTRRVLTPTLAVLLLLSGGYIGVTYGGILNFDSPSQSMGVVWLLATAIALIEFVKQVGALSQVRLAAWLSVLVLLGFTTTGGKISAAAPALAGAILMAGVGIAIHASWARRALLGMLALVTGSLVAYFLMFSGANGGGGLALGALIDRTSSQQGINPIEGPVGVILGTGILVLAVGVRWTGLFWLGSIRENRGRPDVIFAFGLAIAGLAALVLFNGFNEIWFAAAASAPLAVYGAEGFESALDRIVQRGRRPPRAVVVAAIVLALVVFAVVWEIWLTGPAGGSYWRQTWRWTGPFVAVLLALIFGWLIARWCGIPRDRRSVFAAVTVVLVLVSVPGRILGLGSGQVGMPPGLRDDQFSFGNGQVVKGNDTLLIGEIPAGLMAAGKWVRDNASPTDLLATNLTFGPLVPAVTGIRTYASAIQYQSPYGRPSATPQLLQHDEEVWTFINAPSSSSIAPLCEAGVKWVWVEPSETKLRDWQPFATTAFANENAIILELAPGACG